MEKICGECKWHKAHHNYGRLGEYVCGNEDSEYYTDYTEYTDTCEEFEQRGID